MKIKSEKQNGFSVLDATVSIVNDSSVAERALPQKILNNLNLLKTVHFHAAYEIFFVGEKPLKVTTSKQTITFSNCIIVIPPNFIHFTIGSENTFAFLFHLEEKQKPSAFSFIMQTAQEQKIAKFSYSQRMQTLVSLFQEARRLHTAESAQKLSHLYPLLFLELAQQHSSPSSSDTADGKQNDYATQINSILTNDFMINLRLCDVAKKLFLSEKQTARIIRKYFKQSFSVLLLNRRLSIAAMYLAQTKIKVSEIFELTGFQTENYFFSAFKKKYGCTPRAYRLQFQTQRQ